MLRPHLIYYGDVHLRRIVLKYYFCCSTKYASLNSSTLGLANKSSLGWELAQRLVSVRSCLTNNKASSKFLHSLKLNDCHLTCIYIIMGIEIFDLQPVCSLFVFLRQCFIFISTSMILFFFNFYPDNTLIGKY